MEFSVGERETARRHLVSLFIPPSLCLFLGATAAPRALGHMDIRKEHPQADVGREDEKLSEQATEFFAGDFIDFCRHYKLHYLFHPACTSLLFPSLPRQDFWPRHGL